MHSFLIKTSLLFFTKGRNVLLHTDRLCKRLYGTYLADAGDFLDADATQKRRGYRWRCPADGGAEPSARVILTRGVTLPPMW